MLIKEQIAKNLLFHRKKNKLTQKELATQLGVKNSAVSNWETGLNSIDIDTLFNACKIFNISITEMFGCDSIQSLDNTLAKDENTLIYDYRNLNEQGQEYIQQTLELVRDKYKR